MKKLHIAIAAIVIAGGSFATFAFTNANNEVKTVDTTYYVTGQSGNDYTISQNPADDANCEETGNAACKFTSPDSNLGTTIEKLVVDSEAEGITVQSQRTL